MFHAVPYKMLLTRVQGQVGSSGHLAALALKETALIGFQVQLMFHGGVVVPETSFNVRSKFPVLFVKLVKQFVMLI
jgi:hypothetical protein